MLPIIIERQCLMQVLYYLQQSLESVGSLLIINQSRSAQEITIIIPSWYPETFSQELTFTKEKHHFVILFLGINIPPFFINGQRISSPPPLTEFLVRCSYSVGGMIQPVFVFAFFCLYENAVMSIM